MGIRVKIAEGVDISEVTPRIAELIIDEFRKEYLKTGRLPVLYWEVET